MNDELEKKIKAEHERHGKAVAKAIDEFEKKGLNEDESTREDTTKEIEEFEKAVDDEQSEHLKNTLKAIDDSYALEDQHPKKSIDKFKDDVSAEHLNHVKAIDKAIDEFKDSWSDGDHSDRVKAIEEFTKSAQTELDRHEKAHNELLETSRTGETDNEEKALTDAILKAGRAISAKNQEKIKAIVKMIEDHHTEHQKFTDDVTAALKAIVSSGDGGEEHSNEPDGDEPEGDGKKALNSRSSTSGASAELEAYLLSQRLARQVKTAAEGSLRQINQRIKELYPKR